jgi:NADH dehydrogenase FAD-containing subunit
MANIVILGGSYAGISIAHRILKHTPKDGLEKVTMISPNTDIYWNMATPRAAAGVYGDEKIFRPIAPGFEQYGDRFEFVVGSAESLDVVAKTVKLADGQKLHYDILVLATGSRTKAPTVFKGVGSTEDVKEALRLFKEEVKSAQTILISGGGPTGIEFSAEVAYAYGAAKHVYLVSEPRCMRLSFVVLGADSRNCLACARLSFEYRKST